MTFQSVVFGVKLRFLCLEMEVGVFSVSNKLYFFLGNLERGI